MSMKSKLMTSAAALTIMTGAAIAQDTAATPETTEQPAYAQGWNEDLDSQYGDIADTQIAELIGMNVISENGDDVGEVDNFVLMDDELKAVVGVGGFLGLGEHEVALSLSEMTYNGEALVIAFTKEELEAMPEYTDELEAQRLAETDTFRTRQMTEDGQPVETAGVEGATGGMATDAETSSVEGEELAQDGEATIETDETAGQTADASTEIEQPADGSTEMAGTQSIDAEGDTMNIDAEQTAEAGSMENVDAEVEAEGEAMAETEEATVEGEGEMTAEVDPGTPEEASPTGEEVAAAEDAAEAAGQDGDTMTEEVAENEQGEIEQEAEELTAEAGNAAEDAGNALEGAADTAGQELAEAGDAVEGAAEEAGTEMAEAAEATENAVEGAAATTVAAAEGAAEETGDWMANFAEIADWQINEIEGKNVASTDGNVIGEVDDLARQDGKVVALVGIGGFLGLGEHDVALDLANLTWDGEKFIAEGYTEEDLKAMAEYDAETVEMLDDQSTLNDANM